MTKKNEPLDLARYYEQGLERGRLWADGFGGIERIRTKEIIGRYLPPPPAAALDVGGAAGVYSLWLAEIGYEVHLIDPIPLHIEQALEAFSRLPVDAKASARVGNALSLDFADACADLVLLLGPMYHLEAREDRIKALAEARRVLRPSGRLIAAAISRFASFIDGMDRCFLFDDPRFTDIVARDLREGRHRNPTDNFEYFTDAFFHHPDELEREIKEAGFRFEKLIAVEGPLWVAAGRREFDESSPSWRKLLDFLAGIESDRSIIGASPHFLGIGVKE